MFQANAKTTKLPSSGIFQQKHDVHQKARANDALAKQKMTSYGNQKLKVTKANFQVGDLVLKKLQRKCKSDPFYDPEPYKVIKVYGSKIGIERNGQVLYRNSSFLKRFISNEDQIHSRKNTCKRLDNSSLFDEGEAERVEVNESVGEEEVEVKVDLSEEFFDPEGVEPEGDTDPVAEENVTDQIEGDVINKSEGGRPRRETKKPDFYGNPVSHDKKKKSHNSNYI